MPLVGYPTRGRRGERSLNNAIDHWLPSGANFARKYKFTPQVDKQRAVDVSQQVGRYALTECHLVAASTLASVAQIEGRARPRPVQTEREGDSGEGVADGDSPEAITLRLPVTFRAMVSNASNTGSNPGSDTLQRQWTSTQRKTCSEHLSLYVGGLR